MEINEQQRKYMKISKMKICVNQRKSMIIIDNERQSTSHTSDIVSFLRLFVYEHQIFEGIISFFVHFCLGHRYLKINETHPYDIISFFR